jgi:large subunit ribosomal protein L10
VPNAAKVESIEELKERFDGVGTAVLAEYRGLTVRQLSDLRKQLKGASAEFKVVKNRLARLAVRGSALEPLSTHMKGPTGVAFTRQDPVAVAKALQTFVRTNPALTIKVGLVEGKVLEPAALRALADLPSKETLRSQLVGAVQGPLSQLVSLLQAPLRELAYILEQKSQQQAQEQPAPPQEQAHAQEQEPAQPQEQPRAQAQEPPQAEAQEPPRGQEQEQPRAEEQAPAQEKPAAE